MIPLTFAFGSRSLSNQDPSSLKINKFNKTSRAKAAEVIHTNVDFFRFFHPESESFVNASCDPKKNDKPYPENLPELNDFTAPASASKSAGRRATMAKISGGLFGKKSSGSATDPIDESELPKTPTKDVTRDLLKSSAKGFDNIPLPNHRPYLRKLVDQSNWAR